MHCIFPKIIVLERNYVPTDYTICDSSAQFIYIIDNSKKCSYKQILTRRRGMKKFG